MHVAKIHSNINCKVENIMYMNMTVERMNSMFKANANLGTAIVKALKKYFIKNTTIISAGLAAMNGYCYRSSENESFLLNIAAMNGFNYKPSMR